MGEKSLFWKELKEIEEKISSYNSQWHRRWQRNDKEISVIFKFIFERQSLNRSSDLEMHNEEASLMHCINY